jgi:hypothetical protein
MPSIGVAHESSQEDGALFGGLITLRMFADFEQWGFNFTVRVRGPLALTQRFCVEMAHMASLKSWRDIAAGGPAEILLDVGSSGYICISSAGGVTGFERNSCSSGTGLEGFPNVVRISSAALAGPLGSLLDEAERLGLLFAAPG